MERRDCQPRRYTPGEVRPNVLYRLDELKARMGWSDSALRAAKQRGLKVRRDGKRAYLMGEDVISYLKQQTDEQPASSPDLGLRDHVTAL